MGSMPINLDTIKERLSLLNKNSTNLKKTVVNNIFEPLIEHKLLVSFEEDTNGLNGTKYILKIPPKQKT